MTGVSSTTDLNYLKTLDDEYGYGEIQIDFTRLGGREYRCQVRLTLTDRPEESSELSPEDFNLLGTAEFIVTADENNPDDA
jgi:hypothetical protein